MKLLLPVLVLALTPLCPAAGERIAVIPKGTTHNFWKSIEAGARQAGAEAGVEIIWKGPLREDDRAQQIAVVQDFIASGVSAIVLAPSDETALKGPVHSAAEHGIPVVIIDSSVKGELGKDFVSFVATDNRHGGALGGAELVRLTGGKGKVVMLRYAEGQASTLNREAGFLDTVHASPGITLLVDNRFAGATTALAQDTAMNLIDKVREADALFCPNESTTQGMLLALKQTGLAGHKTFVGFDTSPNLLAALGRGEIQALVAQNPRKMGYVGVMNAVKALRHEPFEPLVDTGCVLVTRDNLDSPAVKAVLGP
jgi:ribose transport system substrate-binding protein